MLTYTIMLLEEECLQYSMGKLPSIDCLDEMWLALKNSGSRIDFLAEQLWNLWKTVSSAEEFIIQMNPIIQPYLPEKISGVELFPCD